MSGVQHFFRRLYHAADGDLADDHVYLDLGQQVGFNAYSAVVFGLALLRAAAEHVRDGHAGYADVHHRVLERLEARLLADDLDLCELGRRAVVGRYFLHRHRFRLGNLPRDRDGAVVSVIKTFDRRYEIGVRAGQTMLGSTDKSNFVFTADNKGNVIKHFDTVDCF